MQSRLGKTLNALFGDVAYARNRLNSRSSIVPKLYRKSCGKLKTFPVNPKPCNVFGEAVTTGHGVQRTFGQPAHGMRPLSDNPDVLKSPPNMPEDKLGTLSATAEALQNVSNVVAIVLGGSYARGFARSDSDIDIGIYYRQASPFSADQVRSIAEGICRVGSVPIVT